MSLSTMILKKMRRSILGMYRTQENAPRGYKNAFVFLSFIFLALAPAGAAKEITPRSGLCREINALRPGQELILRGGRYPGPCTIRRGGRPGAPIVIRAENLLDPPWIVYDGNSDNVINVRADYVTLRGLKIGPTQTNVDGIRIYGRKGITVEDCWFSGTGGIAVVANHQSAQGLIVRRNRVLNTSATAMYFGCHDGVSCVVSDLVIERNFIQRVRAPDPAIGYGIQVKLNSTAVIRDNLVLNSKGPGIMVYGSDTGGRESVIERNFIGQTRNSGILVGGGPVTVRNNIAVANADGGIAVQNYAHRNLLRGIVVVHNTLYANNAGGIVIPLEEGVVEAEIVNNAVYGLTDTKALPAERTGVQQVGNMDCRAAKCFAEPDRLNFSPYPTSPLVGAGKKLDRSWMPGDDFFGLERTRSLTVGAIQAASGPIIMDIKP